MKLAALFKRKTPRSSTILSHAPQPSPNRCGIALVAAMKDEEMNIEEWLRFHTIAGVKDFFLYDDGSKDKTRQIARTFSFANVTIIPWQMKASLRSPDVCFSRQALAYAHAIENFGSQFRWMGFIDIDEFLIPKNASCLSDALSHLESVQNVSVPWTMFGPNGHQTRPEGTQIFNFTTRGAERKAPLLNFKCIVDPCDVENVRVHSCTTKSMGANSSNENGERRPNNKRRDPAFVTSDVIQLNHYYTRSYDDMHAKLRKGAMSGSPMKQRRHAVLEKLAVIEKTQVDDYSASEFLKRVGVDNERAFVSDAVFASLLEST